MQVRRFFGGFVAVAVLLVPFFGSSVAAAEPGYVVIVNQGNRLDAIDKDTLSKLFLGTAKTWPDGTPAFPVDFVGNDAVREAFSKGVLGKSLRALSGYWQQRIFSGQGTPPPSRKTEADVIMFVQGTPGAVGFISSGTPLSAVRAVTVK